uniref:Uncharacterized protein n=1 Tax=Aplanochytrium stocchinoi TaxID=215587 RepID=A0A6S8EHS9_9STRA
MVKEEYPHGFMDTVTVEEFGLPFQPLETKILNEDDYDFSKDATDSQSSCSPYGTSPFDTGYFNDPAITIKPLAFPTEKNQKQNVSQSEVELKHETKVSRRRPTFTCEVQLSLRNAFNILVEAMHGEFDANIPTREGASPIYPSETCFYVCGKGRRPEVKKRKLEKSSLSLNPISVKYSSLNPKNCEVYWSSDYGDLLGVVSRAMSKVSRPTNSKNKDAKARSHGYGGRLFSLVKRSEITNEAGKNMKSFLMKDAPSLVQFWKLDNFKCDSIETNSVISAGSSITLSSSATSQSPDDSLPSSIRTFPNDVRVNGDLFIDGELSVRNLHVKGNLLVEGSISGQLVTPPGSADYAEWFAFLNPEEDIRPGMVIQLRSPEQKITLDTSGSGPHMVVSTTPSVAAGVPPSISGTEPIPGALCAFLGQVPVNVVGPVKCGQYLFPSGKNDGYAIAATFKDYNGENEPLGVSMESCHDGKHQVLSFIRWQHNLKFQVLKQKKDKIHKATVGHWLSGFLGLAENIFTFLYLYQRQRFHLDMLMVIISLGLCMYGFTHFPNYSAYWLRGDFLYFLLCSVIRLSMSLSQLAFMILMPVAAYENIVQDALVYLLVVGVEYYRMVKHAEMADGHLWRGEYRKTLLAWQIYDGIIRSVYRSVLQVDYKKGEAMPLHQLLNINAKKKSK